MVFVAEMHTQFMFRLSQWHEYFTLKCPFEKDLIEKSAIYTFLSLKGDQNQISLQNINIQSDMQGVTRIQEMITKEQCRNR